MAKKYTYEEVKKIFENKGFILLSTEYINSKQKLKYKCSCGNESIIGISQVLINQKCRKCSGSEKYTYEFVKEQFEKSGCVLISTEYIDARTNLDYICSCGVQNKIKFHKFQRGQRCYDCRNKKMAKSLTHTYEFIKSEFEKRGFVLLSTEYNGTHKLLDYICSCGSQSQISYNSLQRGTHCFKCSGKKKYTYSCVYNYFKEQGCELLETEYINANILMEYQCKCGTFSKIRWSDFRRGQRCGCELSKGEIIIKKFLKENNIKFEKQKKFEDCKYKNILSFDFYISEKNILIEYDGIQHFEKQEFFGGEKRFKEQQKIDSIKTQYCIDKEIILLRIPYTEINNINGILKLFEVI